MTTCDRCKQETDSPDDITIPDTTLCPGCLEFALTNISNFMDKLLAPDDEFDEWLMDQTLPATLTAPAGAGGMPVVSDE